MNPIRVCSGCNTTKTPLWRSGPKGPKSLCNACGIRQRKARRAMANGTAVSVKIEGKHGHLKKRCKTGIDYATNSEAGSSSDQKQKNMIFFDDFLSKSVSLHRVFPDEEKDAAILLMALSSGLQVYAA